MVAGICCATVAPCFATGATSGSGRCSATRFASNDESLALARGRRHGRHRAVCRAQGHWLAGGDLGLGDPALMQTTTYVVANSITLVLDLVVVALAWVLALGAPQRLLVVLAPLVWGATGLMVTPVLSAAVNAVTGDPSAERLAGDALHAWVYAVVYLGFAVQGVGIAALFGAQVARTWPWPSRRGWRLSARPLSARVGWGADWSDFCCWRAESTRFGSVRP